MTKRRKRAPCPKCGRVTAHRYVVDKYGDGKTYLSFAPHKGKSGEPCGYAFPPHTLNATNKEGR